MATTNTAKPDRLPVNTVFAFIASAMAVVVLTIGGFGPRTRRLALELIAH